MKKRILPCNTFGYQNQDLYLESIINLKFRYLKFILYVFLIIINTCYLSAQDNPYLSLPYSFIREDINVFDLPDNKQPFDRFFSSIDKYLLTGEGQINAIHIGNSHIQADYLTGRIRHNLRRSFQSGSAGRGFIFPYTIARTNNPADYSIRYSGKWRSCKNIQYGRNCELGLSGISITTYDTYSEITITLSNEDYREYDFNKVKIFHKIDSLSYSVEIYDGQNTIKGHINDSLGYSIFNLNHYSNYLSIRFRKTSDSQSRFVLYGLSLDNDGSGITYHSIGVNGAEIQSYLRCVHFTKHMAALNPDLIIISLGANELNKYRFNEEEYKQNYATLINNIQNRVPETAIILTVPGDSYRRARYLNFDTEKLRKIIYDIAGEYNCGVWDFYTIMGGLNSIVQWRKFNLSAYDNLHYTKRGYILQGDLFFNALLKAYDGHITEKEKLEQEIFCP